MSLASTLSRLRRRISIGLCRADPAGRSGPSKQPPNRILKDLYDSEINFSIVTFWHGMAVRLGDECNGFKATTSVGEWEEAEVWLREKAIDHYPSSVFAIMYRDGLSYEQATERQRRLRRMLA